MVSSLKGCFLDKYRSARGVKVEIGNAALTLYRLYHFLNKISKHI
jgi:hypothetical protein